MRWILRARFSRIIFAVSEHDKRFAAGLCFHYFVGSKIDGIVKGGAAPTVPVAASPSSTSWAGRAAATFPATSAATIIRVC